MLIYKNFLFETLVCRNAETLHLHLRLHLIDLHRYKYICKQAPNSYARIINREGKADKKKSVNNKKQRKRNVKYNLGFKEVVKQ